MTAIRALTPLGLLKPLPRAFYRRPTAVVARDLLGKLLVQPGAQLRLARIVEVEAYLGQRDTASHARRGPTPRAAIMFGPPGFLYVYLVYGMHHCMNVVTEPDGRAGAVLIRAAQPVIGFAAPPSDDRAAGRLLSGPGKICAAMGVTRAHNGLDLCGPLLFLAAEAGAKAPRAKRSPRIGVDYATPEWATRKLRFYVPGNPSVSGRPRD